MTLKAYRYFWKLSDDIWCIINQLNTLINRLKKVFDGLKALVEYLPDDGCYVTLIFEESVGGTPLMLMLLAGTI